MGYNKIGDYGIVGNGITLALVSQEGSIDWLCLPYMDSGSVFGAILDDEKGGRFRLSPAPPWDAFQDYLPRTNILRTRFRTRRGESELVDFMPIGPRVERDPSHSGRIVRYIRCLSGRMDFEVECTPRFDYARETPAWRVIDPCNVILSTDTEQAMLSSTRALKWQSERAVFSLSAGESLWITFSYDVENVGPDVPALESLLEQTESYWVDWTRSAETGRFPHGGFWQEQLDRSALVLKLLQMRATGAIAAAATTSLPAIIYGERNWDYRFAWIRDASMTLSALFELGHLREVSEFLNWTRRICEQDPSGRLHVVYRLRHPTQPDGETELPHLSGYKGSRPVRIGQFVIHQRQHDIYGELMDTAFAMSRYIGKIRPEHWAAFRPLVDHVTRIWQERDDGIWEARIGAQHYTHSKLMCWVALDRGIKIAEHYGFPSDLPRWKEEREKIRQAILTQGYNTQKGTFVQHDQTEAVDAALLLIPLSGFLPIDDERVKRTIEGIERELLRDGVMLRYIEDDGLEGQEWGFMICLFWYLHCLIMQGRLDEVEDYLRNIGRYANHLGLFGEQFDPRFGEITGNFPQAYSHIGYATVVLRYLDARSPKAPPPPKKPMRHLGLLFHAPLLNPSDGRPVISADHPDEEMKRAMNILRGQFYDGHNQRVDYGAIAHSRYYDRFVSAAAGLRDFNPGELATDAEKIAFWVNVYNTFVIHGVIALRIADSIKEVPFFFNRIRYRIGGLDYTPDDIEHGILRGNATPPYRLGRQFRRNDPRLQYVVSKPDPRIHFALVCASRTCPPIEAYEADHLDDQLETSAQVFINGTTRYDNTENVLYISEIFKWYRRDFGLGGEGVVDYIARYLYDGSVREALMSSKRAIPIRYTPYDWRLNR